MHGKKRKAEEIGRRNAEAKYVNSIIYGKMYENPIGIE